MSKKIENGGDVGMIILTFETRQAFRDWLSKHHSSEAGVWLRFGKSAQIKTLKASEALEEALCFGWIDEFFWFF